MKSLGARLAISYAVASTATMICLFLIGRYSLEHYAIHGIDLLLQDEFRQIENHLGTDYATLTPAQLQERMRGSAAYESVLFYYEMHARGHGTLFRSANLRGRTIPDVPGEQFFNVHIDGEDAEMRVAEFILGPLDVMIATSKAHVKTVMDGYLDIFLGLLALVLVVNAAIGFILSRLALRPIRLIQETAAHISSDNLTERIPVSDVQDEISNLAQLLNRTFDRLESSFNQVRRFTAEASHELKTPLSLVRLQAEKLMVEGGLSPSQEESIQIQLEEITRLNQIIEDLLFLSRAEARAITLVTRREDPRRFLQNFGTDARVLCEHRGIRFVEMIEGSGLVDFDPKWIRQVLLNLVANALNASPPGGSLRLISDYASGVWRVALEDEGSGVPPGQRDRIFERFVRLEQPGRERPDKGSGLGLAISRSIVGLHRGAIHAEESPAGGLRVVFEIPLAPSSEEHRPDSAEPAQSMAGAGAA